MSDDDDQRFNNYSMPTPTQSQSSLSFIPNQISDTANVVTDSSNNNSNKRKRRSSSSTSLPQQHQPMKFKKAPGAPRRFKSAFIFYSTQKHKEIRSSLGKAGAKEKTTNVAKMVSEAWKKLEPEEREYWEDMARKDKERYELEKSIYNGPWKVPAEKAVKDPNAPKRPMSAFLSYSNSKRSQVKKQFPHLSNAEVSRILANMWKEASDDEKQSFIDHEYKLRQQYKVAIAEWRANAQHEKHYERLQREEMALQTLEAHKQLKEGGGDKGNGTSSSSAAAGATDCSDPSLSLRAMLIERQRKQQREREREQRERQQREREQQQQQQQQNVNEASSPSHASSNNSFGIMSGASTGNSVMPESLSSSHLDQQQPFMDGLSPSWTSSGGGGYGVGYGGYGSHSHYDPSGFYGSSPPMGYPHHHSHSSSSHLLPGSSMEASSSSLSSYMGGGSNTGNVFDYGYHQQQQQQQHQHYHNQAGASGSYPPPYSFHHGTTAMSAAPWSSSRGTSAASASASASFGNGSLSDMHDNQHNQHANGGFWGSAGVGVGVGAYASYPLTDGGYYGSGSVSGAMPNNDQQSYASRQAGTNNTAVATDENDEEDYVRSDRYASNTDDKNNNNKTDNNYLGGIFDASSSSNNQNDDNFP